MKLDRPLVNAIIARKPPGVDLGDWIADQSGLIDGIARRLRACASRRAEAHARYAEALAPIEAEQRAIRGECPHYTTTRHGDPAGGSGSFGACDQCGEVRP